MFAYCNNNPVVHKDAQGTAVETVWDIISLGTSVLEVALNPSDPWAWAGLVGDLLDVAIPCVGGIGEATRALSAATDFVDGAHDVIKADDLVDAVGDISRTIDFYVGPAGDVIPASRVSFDYNLSKMEYKGGKYYGMDSNKMPVRVRVEKHLETHGYSGPINPYHTAEHFHVDRRQNGLSGKWEKILTGLMEWLH